MILSADNLKLSYDEISNISFKAQESSLSIVILNIEDFTVRWLNEHSEVQKLASELTDETQKRVFSYTRKLVLKMLAELQSRLPVETTIIKEAQVVILPFLS